MESEVERRKRDSARLTWDTKPRRAVNPKDIEFQTAEIVIPNPTVESHTLTSFANEVGKYEIDKSKMNRLIWGDNLLAMQALLASGYEGKINLIYIDPPFWTGENYYSNMSIEGEEITKSPSVIERLAYKDIWEAGIDSYLDMLYPRLQLMKRLLAENGSIYVHIDYHVGHYVKVIMDEIFDKENFKTEIIWSNESSSGYKSQANKWIRGHDIILYYTKSSKYTFNKEHTAIDERAVKRYDKIDEKGLRYKIYYERDGSQRRVYLNLERGKSVSDVWTDMPSFQTINNTGEYLGYPTQKPEDIIKRIILESIS